MAEKISANERRLAKLLYAYRDSHGTVRPDEHACYARFDAELAAFLARRGVLAVSAQTVPVRDWPEGVVGMVTLRTFLRRLARGGR
jgi:hypothetical protein